MFIYIVPAGIQRTRLNIMHKATSKIGLKLAPNYSNDVKYVVSELENYEAILKNLKVTEQDSIKADVVKMLWFFDSLKAGYALPSSTYLIQNNTVKMEKSLEEDVKRRYLCQSPTLLNHKNVKFVAALEILAHEAEMRLADYDNSRALAFRKAAGALKQIPKEIISSEEVEHIADIGQHSRLVIQEIIETSACEEVKRVESSDLFRTLKLFTSIYGVGPAKANQLYIEGLRTLESVKSSCSIRLDGRIRFGLAYYNDLATPVTKGEAEEILKIVSIETEYLLPGTVLYLMGGFCRGKQTGHDVDILITHPDDGKEIGLLKILCQRLEKRGLLIHQVIVPRRLQLKKGSTIDNFDKCFAIFKLVSKGNVLQTRDNSGTEEFGVCTQLTTKWSARRVDLIVCPHQELPFALVGWTGSKLFNRSLRNYAKKELNMKLTSHYLYDLTTNTKVIVHSEEELFSKLRLPFLKPQERNL